MKKKFATYLVCISISLFSCNKENNTKNEPQPASVLYYSNSIDSSIGKIDLKNGNISTIFSKGVASGIQLPTFAAFALNTLNGEIYLSIEENPGIIYKINTIGMATVLYSGSLAKDIRGIAYNSKNNNVYWINNTGRTIYRINADGTGTPTGLYGSTNVGARSYGLALDERNGKLYFTNFDAIFVGNLDGTGIPSTLYENRNDTIEQPNGLTLDITNNKIYWTDESADVVASANLDGTGNFKILFNNTTHGVDRSDGLAIDSVAKKIYWSETASSTARIRVGNLDGTGTPTTLKSGLETYGLILK